MEEDEWSSPHRRAREICDWEGSVYLVVSVISGVESSSFAEVSGLVLHCPSGVSGVPTSTYLLSTLQLHALYTNEINK